MQQVFGYLSPQKYIILCNKERYKIFIYMSKPKHIKT